MQLTNLLNEFDNLDAIHLLGCGQRGMEKEGLRYTDNNQLSQKLHPKKLGSPLTHEEITTDYAESLLELVTPAFCNSQNTLSHLCYLHRVIATYSDGYILNASMPAFIDNPEKVQIGQYGLSSAGKMRELYRKGLALRYGKAMQLIAGMHFNYSICNTLFRYYANILGYEFNQKFINERYMNIVRNIRRYAWLTTYLFGHSPVVDKSFFNGKPHKLQDFDNNTLYLPYATSLRMSEIGYQNKTKHLVTANTLEAYVEDLKSAVLKPNATYQSYGLKDKDGNYQQINTNLLQIENEYYTVARPKQPINRGEAPVKALAERGIAYIELRTLDINCFERTGISQEQLDFLELFMLFCLFIDAPTFNKQDESEAQINMDKASCCGRDPKLTLKNNNKTTTIAKWGTSILKAMHPIAKFMDEGKDNNHYTNLINNQLAVVNNPELTPAARIMTYLSGQATGKPMSYHEFITNLSKKHTKISRQMGLTYSEKIKTLRDAKRSLEKEKILTKKSSKIPFEDYLDSYFRQL